MPGHWAGSDRRSTLPPDWATKVRPRILTRDGHRCTWLGDLDPSKDGLPGEYMQAVDWNIVHLLGNRCTARATDVDHIGDPDDHTDTKLRSLCSWHHGRRSSRQGNTARGRLRARLTDPPARHPGLLG